MRIGSFFLAGVALIAAANAQEAVPRLPDGTVVSETRCQFTPYDQASAFTRRYYSSEDYQAAIGTTAVDCFRIQYLSDGLRVVGYIVKPRGADATRYPVIVFNRGGFREIGKIDAWNLVDFYGFASRGFVVLASQYRGNDGGEGRDEVGGADVADVMNLAALAGRLPYADPANVFLYGLSRGGMMTFLALKRGFPARAAAVVGAVFDAEAFGQRAPKMVESALRFSPDTGNRVATLRERSAMNWPEAVSAPVLIIHGAKDEEVPAAEALLFAGKLAQLGKRYELIVYADDVHEAANNRRDRDTRIASWFNRHIRH